MSRMDQVYNLLSGYARARESAGQITAETRHRARVARQENLQRVGRAIIILSGGDDPQGVKHLLFAHQDRQAALDQVEGLRTALEIAEDACEEWRTLIRIHLELTVEGDQDEWTPQQARRALRAQQAELAAARDPGHKGPVDIPTVEAPAAPAPAAPVWDSGIYPPSVIAVINAFRKARDAELDFGGVLCREVTLDQRHLAADVLYAFPKQIEQEIQVYLIPEERDRLFGSPQLPHPTAADVRVNLMQVLVHLNSTAIM